MAAAVVAVVCVCERVETKENVLPTYTMVWYCSKYIKIKISRGPVDDVVNEIESDKIKQARFYHKKFNKKISNFRPNGYV